MLLEVLLVMELMATALLEHGRMHIHTPNMVSPPIDPAAAGIAVGGWLVLINFVPLQAFTSLWEGCSFPG